MVNFNYLSTANASKASNVMQETAYIHVTPDGYKSVHCFCKKHTTVQEKDETKRSRKRKETKGKLLLQLRSDQRMTSGHM